MLKDDFSVDDGAILIDTIKLVHANLPVFLLLLASHIAIDKVRNKQVIVYRTLNIAVANIIHEWCFGNVNRFTLAHETYRTLGTLFKVLEVFTAHVGIGKLSTVITIAIC